MKRREGFVHKHEAVHTELERQLASRNTRRSAVRDLPTLNKSARVLESNQGSQLEHQLSSRNPRQAAGQEQTTIS